jgi:hypothetical protein
MTNSLIKFWSAFDPHPSVAGLHVHPLDRKWFEDNQPVVLEQPVETFDRFLAGPRFGRKDDDRLHLSLLPAPFHGNLRTAKIFILLMNPGFATSDYYAEEDHEFRSASIANLRQKGIDRQFPYFSLNPKFAWSGAYQWIESRMRKILWILQEKRQLTYLEALAFLSKQIAVIQLFPYHSVDGQAIPSRCWSELPSVLAARQFVKGELTDSPKQPLIIVARSHAKWDVRAKGNVTSSGGTRGVTFNPHLIGKNGKPGQEILRRLLD